MRKSTPVSAYPEGLVRCPNCAVFFKPEKPRHRFCSSTCRVAAFKRRQLQELREGREELRRLHEAQGSADPSLRSTGGVSQS